MGVGPDNPWAWMVAQTPDNPPELDINDYKGQYLLDARIPKCEDAKDGQLCY